MESWAKKQQLGFTLVELLIVVTVIAILATITIVAYNGIQQRGRDTVRLSDVAAIKKALELYKTSIGNYPDPIYSGLGNQAGWEVSAREATGEFLAPLKPYGFTGGVPVDPINDAIDATLNLARSSRHYGYSYYKYPAGTSGCDANRGPFYVLGIISTEISGIAVHPQSPGFSCGSSSWNTNFSWVTGEYER
jgi:prepilin-type N-terminal cleavage/methylation domain-containing protein